MVALTKYRQNVEKYLLDALAECGELNHVLDFGAGNGEFAQSVSKLDGVRQLTAIDVVQREKTFFPVESYDGNKLPYEDGKFDLVYSIDVIHHSPHPIDSLKELARCTNKYLLLKDHVTKTKLDRLIIGALDELGNRRFGIPSPYNYQRGWSWIEEIKKLGFSVSRMVNPLYCEIGPIGWVANRLQFIAVFERIAK